MQRDAVRDGGVAEVMSRFLDWFFRSRDTGRITIAQAPNLVLWIVIAAGLVRWLLVPAGTLATVAEVAFKGGLVVWALDEIVRGVNPWRRCLGAAVLAYQAWTLL